MKTLLSILTMLGIGLTVGGRTGISTAVKKHVSADRHGDPLPDGAIARLGTIRYRHGDRVLRSVAYAMDGKVVASTGRLPGLCLWDAKTGRLLHQLPLPEYKLIETLAVSPDGSKLFTGHSLIDVATGKEERRFKLPFPKYYSSRAAISSDGKTVAYADGAKITLLDVGTGNELRNLDGHKYNVRSLTFSPKDRKVLASTGVDKTVRLWDADTGKQLHKLEGHGKRVHAGAFSPDGKVLASGGDDGVIRLWDVATGKPGRQLVPDNAVIYGVTFSPKGTLLACTGSGGVVSLWNPDTGKKIRQWVLHDVNSTSTFSSGPLDFAPDGKTLAATTGSSVSFWDVETGTEINPIPCHRAEVISVRFEAGRNALVSCDLEGRVVAWDIKSHRSALRPFSGTAAPVRTEYWATRAISSDGKVLAQAKIIPPFKEDTAIRLWDTVADKQIHLLNGHTGSVWVMKFSPCGKFLVSRGIDGIRLWDTAKGKESHHMVEMTNTGSLAFSADSKILASGGSNKTIHLWDVATGKELHQWECGKEPVSSFAFSPDGKMILCAVPGGVRVRTADAGKEIRQLNGNMGTTTFAFSPSGRILACGGWGIYQRNSDELYRGKLKLWEFDTGQEIRTIETAQGRISALAFAPDGRTLASGSANSTILLWDLARHGTTNPIAPTAADLDKLWADLATDAAKADHAHGRLVLSPQQSGPFLAQRMRAAVPPAAKEIARLLADLDSENFETRKKADLALVKLGESAESALRKRLEANPSLELRRRVEQILEKREPEVLRQLRAIETLEQIGSAETRAVLKTLAKGTSNPRVAQAAVAALQRFARAPLQGKN